MDKFSPRGWDFHKILPIAFDDSLSYLEFLGKMCKVLNTAIDEINTLTEAVSTAVVKSDIMQTTGQNTDRVMSQKAVTDAIVIAGGVTPVLKTDAMTQAVGIDTATGRLFTLPGSGSSITPIARTSEMTQDVGIDSTTHQLYTKPAPNINPTSKTSAMTQDVGIDADTGKLYTKPQEGDVVNADTKSTDMTQSVGIDSNGKLWTTPFDGDEVHATAKTAAMTQPVGIEASTGNLYTTPASGDEVHATAKTSAMTQAVGIDSNGALWTTPGGSSAIHLYKHHLYFTDADGGQSYLYFDILNTTSTSYTTIAQIAAAMGTQDFCATGCYDPTGTMAPFVLAFYNEDLDGLMAEYFDNSGAQEEAVEDWAGLTFYDEVTTLI